MIKFIIQFLFYNVLFYNVLFFNMLVNAEDIESFQQRQLEMVTKCAKDFPISSEDIEQFTKHQMLDNIKCRVACIYKSSGVMDDQGMLSVEGVNKIAHMYLSEDPERPKQAKHFTDTCLSVNDIEVSDGDMGCERAALMYKCGVEESPEFDFIEEIVTKTIYTV